MELLMDANIFNALIFMGILKRMLSNVSMGHQLSLRKYNLGINWKLLCLEDILELNSYIKREVYMRI